MDKAVSRYMAMTSSVSGTDKVFRLVYYTAKFLSHILRSRSSASPLATKLDLLAAPISDSRMLLRFPAGFLYMVMSSLNPSKNPNVTLRTLENLMTLSMLVYYPLEHIYYLGAHKIINLSDQKVGRASLWSCRAWALYCVLDIIAAVIEFKQNAEKARELAREASKVSKRDVSAAPERAAISAQIASLAKARRGLIFRLLMEVCDLPLAVHWSLESYPLSPGLVGAIGLLGSLVYLKAKWEATQ